MDTSHFTKDSPGHLVSIGGSLHAFVPDPLPRDVPMDDETHARLIEAVLDRSLEPMTACGKVVRLAGRRFLSGSQEESLSTPPIG